MLRSFSRAARLGSLCNCLGSRQPSRPIIYLSNFVLVRQRPFATSRAWNETATASASEPENAKRSNSAAKHQDVIYHGPLAMTFRRLKLFSLTSMGLAATISPFIVLLESNLPMSARYMLAATAVATSGISTALIAWISRPYVSTLRRGTGPNGQETLELTTTSLFLKPEVTKVRLLFPSIYFVPISTQFIRKVYRPEFLVDTKRAFAKWELAKEVILPSDGPTPSGEELVAETLAANGRVIGRWTVQWGPDGEGSCKGEGNIVRYATLS
jgi:hypothetical protein